MTNNFLTFQKFNDPELAATIASHLRESGIPSEIVKEAQVFDPTFANNDFEPTIHLKLLPSDFTRAQAALEAFYQAQLTNLPPDYYLFSFTDTELVDIVKHPDEWGQLDYALAKKLLAERGQIVTADQEASFHHERLKDLKKPETTPFRWIIAGYILAVYFCLIGMIIGYVFAYMKKTLPNGEQIYTYSQPVRNHGKRILVLALIVFALWMGLLFSARPIW